MCVLKLAAQMFASRSQEELVLELNTSPKPCIIQFNSFKIEYPNKIYFFLLSLILTDSGCDRPFSVWVGQIDVKNCTLTGEPESPKSIHYLGFPGGRLKDREEYMYNK
jgi:hypothetical protein